MRILQLTPGTGTFLCGSCMRDNLLVRALREAGHDATIAPLYLPFALEDPGAAPEAAVHMGGINVYLQQKLPLLKFLPGFLHDRLDSPRLLRWAASRSNMTDSSGLGAMTLSMLRGEEGRQRKELERLIDWLRHEPRPDVVILSNAMLVGLAREIQSALGCPVVLTLQGEPPFLDGLREPYRAQCWAELGLRVRELPAALAVSRYTADLMIERLGLDPARVHVVWNGIDATDFVPDPARRDAARPRVGFMARMCTDKGLETLFEAYLVLKRRLPAVRLAVAGEILNEDRALIAHLRARAAALGVAEDIELRGKVSREEKIEFLQGLDVLSVPATYGESFGLYLLEAWACGVPVVQPRHGAFPELIEATGGGDLCDPSDPADLAAVLERALSDPGRRAQQAESARAVVLERFNAARMAREVADVCRMAAAAGA